MPFLSKYLYAREICICISVKLRIYATKEALISHFSFREKEREKDRAREITVRGFILLIIESSFFSATHTIVLSVTTLLSTKETRSKIVMKDIQLDIGAFLVFPLPVFSSIFIRTVYVYIYIYKRI